MTSRLAVLVALAACGDNVHVDDVFEPTSGARIKLEWHLYEDGTRQAETSVFYDIGQHARCTPQRWADDVIRCVPTAEDAVFIDATCEQAVGRMRVIEKPTHFIAYDELQGTTLPARLYRAGAVMTTPPSSIYELRDGMCVGPRFAPSDVTYFSVLGGIDGEDLVEVRDEEFGEGRLAVQYRATDDGVRIPYGLRDHTLDLPCTPAPRPGGALGCAPTEAMQAFYFRDSACADPIVTLYAPEPVPAVATLPDPSGCTQFHAIGAEVSGPIYQRSGGACTRIVFSPVPRQFLVGDELELARLDRTVEDVPARRLQRIVLGEGDLRFIHSRLYDTATRTDCERRSFGEATRCLPTAMTTGTTLLTRSCAVAVPVAQVPLHACERSGFATALTEDVPTIHAIGDRPTEALYWFGNTGCEPYPDVPGTEVRLLGPALAPETFPAAVTYGER